MRTSSTFLAPPANPTQALVKIQVHEVEVEEIGEFVWLHLFLGDGQIMAHLHATKEEMRQIATLLDRSARTQHGRAISTGMKKGIERRKVLLAQLHEK